MQLCPKGRPPVPSSHTARISVPSRFASWTAATKWDVSKMFGILRWVKENTHKTKWRYIRSTVMIMICKHKKHVIRCHKNHQCSGGLINNQMYFIITCKFYLSISVHSFDFLLFGFPLVVDMGMDQINDNKLARDETSDCSSRSRLI